MISALVVVFALAMYPRPQAVTGDFILIVGAALAALAVLQGVKHPKPLALPWLFVLLAFTSTYWSSNQSTTFTFAAALAVPLFTAGLISPAMDFKRFLSISDKVLKLAVVISIALSFFAPSVGLTQRVVNSGTLRGLYEHRNHMGTVLAIAVVTHLAVSWGEKKGFARRWIWIGVFVYGLVEAGSAGALVLMAGGLMLYGVVRFFSSMNEKAREPVAVAVIIFAVVATPILYVSRLNLFGLVGRDGSLTGRTTIWNGAYRAWEYRPWLGHGWGNILGEDTLTSRTISLYAGYTVRSAHNGYVATALQLGVVGLTLSVLILLLLIFQLVRRAIKAPGAQSLWSLQIVVILAIGDFFETRAFVNIGWFLLMVIAYYLKREANEEKPNVEQVRKIHQKSGKLDSKLARRPSLTAR